MVYNKSMGNFSLMNIQVIHVKHAHINDVRLHSKRNSESCTAGLGKAAECSCGFSATFYSSHTASTDVNKI